MLLDKTDVLFLNFDKKLNIREKNLNSSCSYKHEENKNVLWKQILIFRLSFSVSTLVIDKPLYCFALLLYLKQEYSKVQIFL